MLVALWLVAGACANPGGDGGGAAGASGGASGTSGGASGGAGAGGTSGVAGAAATAGGGGSGAGTGGTGTGVAGTGGATGGGGGGATGGAGRGGGSGASGGLGGGAGGRGGTSGGGTTGGAGAGGAAGGLAIVIPGAGSCTAPAGATTADAAAAYQKWKTDLLTSDGAGGFLRVRRPNSSSAEVNSSVSEGIAYGMLLAVYADDQPTFDKLWQYAKLWPDSNGLMNWYINAAGTQVLGTGGATDADEDMAFALIMADARWKGRGSLTTNYIDLAKTQIGLIWAHEVDHSRNDVLMAGDQFADGSVINISYFAPAFYRVFGRVTGTDDELEAHASTRPTRSSQRR